MDYSVDRRSVGGKRLQLSRLTHEPCRNSGRRHRYILMNCLREDSVGIGVGYAESLNAAPHLKINGTWCELTWLETNPDGSKQKKRIDFPTSNIHSFKWME